MILTRFSRVTFNVAHKYLGLTTELLRTEKSINELARHPLPQEFYQGGGMQKLRQRFMPDFKEEEESPSGGGAEPSSKDEGPSDYFNFPIASSSSTPSASSDKTKTNKKPKMKSPSSIQTVFSSPSVSSPTAITDSPVGLFRRRSQVHAGDLLSMTGSSPTTTFRSTFPRNSSALFTPAVRSFQSHQYPSQGRAPPSPDSRRSKASDFDLKEGVMDCIARSIGLVQPPMSMMGSPEASPALVATDPVYPSFRSSFSSLSLLSTAQDDASSVAASSVFNHLRNDGIIDNEVEILFFKSGDTLVKAGERNAGKRS